MELRGVDYGRIWGGSGVQGFFGEGYWYHRWLAWAGLNFDGMTFVAKTTPLEARKGNMELRADSITPAHRLPDCISVRPLSGSALNAVGLSSPGAQFLLDQNRWQQRDKPFFLSFMSLQETAEQRLDDLKAFVDLLAPRLPQFQAPVGLQDNVSCPNVGLAHNMDMLTEIERRARVAQTLGIPYVVKVNALTSPRVVMDLHGAVDALCCSNTIPFGALVPKHSIPFRRLWGKKSPLARRGYPPGGYSGKYLYPIVRDWLIEARRCSDTFPINAGGGILHPRQAIELLEFGADSVFIASMAFLRPWRVAATIRATNNWRRS